MGLGLHDEEVPRNENEPEKRKLNESEDIELKKITVQTKDSEYPEIISQKTKRLLKTNHLKYTLILFNFILSILGILILVLAIWVRCDPEFFEYDSTMDIDDYYKACYMFIFAGFVILVVAFLGCCGAITENQFMLIAYFAIFLVIFIVEMAAVIIIFIAPYNRTIEGHIEKQIRLQIERRETHESSRSFMDFIQAHLECCGSKSQKDYYSEVPNSCQDQNTGSLYEKGCTALLLNYLKKKAGLIGGIAMPILLLQLLALLVSFCLIYNIKKESGYSI